MPATTLVDTNGAEVTFIEGASGNLTVTFLDMDAAAINEATLATLTLTLYNAADNSVINSRSSQNVLDANGGTVATSGVLTMRLDASDNPIVDSTLSREQHIARFAWTWSDGVSTRTGIKEVSFFVENLPSPS